MDTLLRFGSGDELYTFDTTQQVSLDDSFLKVMTKLSRLPGLQGAFDEYGDAPAPADTGEVRVAFWVMSEQPSEMLRLKRAVAAMKAWGKKRLYKRPWGSGSELYCEARFKNLEFKQEVTRLSHRRLLMMLTFEVDNPMWYSLGTEAWSWGDGTLWGSAPWGGNPVEESVIGSDNSFSLTPEGNDIIYPRITIEIPTGKSATNIRIQRRRQGVVIDEVSYTGTLSAGSVLEINCRAYSVMLNGSDGYSSAFDFETASWFRLVAGISNDIRVLMNNPTDEATIKFRYYEAYNV